MSSLYYTQPTTGSSVATDLVGSINFQVLKLDLGAPGLSVSANGAAIGDAEVAASGLVVAARAQLYSPAGGFDRVRSLNVSGHATATGLPAVAALFFDSSTGLYRAASGQVLGDALANLTAPLIGAVGLGWNGASYDWLQVDGSKNLKVMVANAPNVGQTAGPWAVSGTVSVGNTPTVSQGPGPWSVSGTVTVQDGGNVISMDGAAASGAVASGNPVRNAGVTRAGLVQDLVVDDFRSLQVSNRYGQKMTYMASSGQIQSSNVAGSSTSLAVVWHPSQNAKKCQLLKLHVSSAGASGGLWTLHLNRITANGTGGATGTVVAMDGGDPNSGQLFVMGETGAPTRAAGDLASWIVGGGGMSGAAAGPGVQTPVDFVLSPADWWDGKPPTLRVSASEGWEVRSVCRAAGNAAPSHTVTSAWTEE